MKKKPVGRPVKPTKEKKVTLRFGIQAKYAKEAAIKVKEILKHYNVGCIILPAIHE
jgi:hypothetical protein